MTFEERLAVLEAQAAANQLPASLAALQRKLEATWQPEAGVLLQAGSVGTGVLADDSVTDEKLATRTLRGVVTAAGAVSIGSGFSSVRNAAGDYTVTFTTAFSSTPVVLLGAGATAVSYKVKHHATTPPSASAFRVAALDDAGALVDGIFTFIAMEA